MLKRVVSRHLISLTANNPHLRLKNGFRQIHSTEIEQLNVIDVIKYTPNTNTVCQLVILNIISDFKTCLTTKCNCTYVELETPSTPPTYVELETPPTPPTCELDTLPSHGSLHIYLTIAAL